MDSSPTVAPRDTSTSPTGHGPDGRGRFGAIRTALVLFAVCFAIAMLTRFVGISNGLTADENTWFRRAIDFDAAIARGDAPGTLLSGHPGVTVMWSALVGMGPGRLRPALADSGRPIERAPGYLDAMAAAQRSVAIATAALTSLAIVLAYKLLGPGPGLVGSGLLLLDQYVIGTSRLIHVDALLAPLMTVAALAGALYWLDGRRWGYLALSAITGGLALLTKAPAVLIPFYVSTLALATARPWRTFGLRLLPLLLWAAVAGLVCVGLWPALRSDLLGTMRHVGTFALSTGGSPHEFHNFFLGRVMTTDPGPLYYPVALAFRLGPLAILGLVLLAVLGRDRRLPGRPILWLVAYLALFMLVMTLGAKKFDRYMLPAIMILDLLAGIGLWAGLGLLKPPHLRIAALSGLVALQVALLTLSYPYPIAAYNALAGGQATAERALVVGWGEGLEQAIDYLNSLPDAERLTATTLYDGVLGPLFRGTTLGIDSAASLENLTGYDYFIVYVNMRQRDLISSEVKRAMESGPPERTIYVLGREYAWLYRVSPGSRG